MSKVKIPKTVIAYATIRETVEKRVRVVIPADRAGDAAECIREMCDEGAIDILDEDAETPEYVDEGSRSALEITGVTTSAEFRTPCAHCAECDVEDGQVFCTAFDEWRDMDYCGEACCEYGETVEED